MDKADTLYDITDIPYFPYSPGLLDWCLFAAGAFVILTGLYFYSRNKKKRQSFQAFSLCQHELQELSSRAKTEPQHGKEILYRASLLTRRLISSIEGDISNLSAKELENYKNSCAETSLQALLQTILTIEENKYKPQNEIEAVHSFFNTIVEKVNEYKTHKMQIQP